MSNISAAPSRATPTKSSDRGAPGIRLAGIVRNAAASVTAPSGRFTRKIGRQSRCAMFPTINRPPSSGPATVARPWTTPNNANTRPRSGPAKQVWMVAEICGNSSPAPTPCITRHTTSNDGLVAAPHSTLVAVNRTSPKQNNRR